MINEIPIVENFIIKSEHEIKSLSKSLSNQGILSNYDDDDIIWINTIFDKYNEQKIDQNVFIDLTNDDLNLLLDDTNNLDFFQSSNSNALTQINTQTAAEVKNEALSSCMNQNEKKCEYCNKVFYKLYNYKRHLLIHNNEYPYKCDYCSHKFKDQSNYRKHIKLCSHQNDEKTHVTMNAQEQQQMNSSTLKIYKYKCDFCEKRFYKKFNLTRHMNMHKLNCAKVEDDVANGTGDSTKNSSNGSFYECEVCFKKFNEMKQLSLHNQNWHKQLEHKIECNFCKKEFNIKYEFFTHRLNCKEKNNSILKVQNKHYKCNKCKKSFTKAYNLNRHLASRHENGEQQNQVKKHVCKFCSKSFYECNKLKQHINNCHVDSKE